MMKKYKNMINKLMMDWWIFIFLIVFVLAVICLKLSEVQSTIFGMIFATIILVISIWKELNKKQKYKNMKFDVIDNMLDKDLSKILKSYYERLGYQIQNVKYARYNEVKLMLTKRNKRYLLIGKAYKNIVTMEKLQKIIELKEKHNVNVVIFATNNYFSDDALKFAKRNKIYLFDRDKLIEYYYLIYLERNQ